MVKLLRKRYVSEAYVVLRWLLNSFSPDTNRFLLVYDEIVRLIQAHGGVRAKTFQVKNFEAGIPDLKYPNNAI